MDERERPGRVTVGYDGSKHAWRALVWATDEAMLRRLPLTVCHAWRSPYPLSQTDADVLETMRRSAQLVLDHGARHARRGPGAPQVGTRLVWGTAASALVAESADADLLVVGARGEGGFPELAVGATAVQVCTHARAPVIVVRGTGIHTVDRPHIVVGVDGSPASEAALGFALEEAALRRGTVRILCCWHDAGSGTGTPAVPFPEAGADDERAAAARFQHLVAPWLEKYRTVEATASFLVTPTAGTLLDAAADAHLLVVGNRGVGTAPETLLGAVARRVLHDAPCSVAVVHDRHAGAR